MVVEALRLVGASVEFVEEVRGDFRQWLAAIDALGNVSAEFLAALAQVRNLGRVVGWTIERQLLDFFVRQRNTEARTKRLQLFFVQLLLLVRDVLAFAAFTESVTFNGAGEDDSRLALVLDRSLVRRVNLQRIVSAETADVATGRRCSASPVRAVADTCRRSVDADKRRIRRHTSAIRRPRISLMRWTSRPSLSLARIGSQSEPQMTLITFHPAPRKAASSSWMMLPLPRTGPSSRCRLQLMTKMRLSRRSRATQA